LAFWSGDKILTELKANTDILNPFDELKIDNSSYRMALGGEYFITPDHDVKRRDSTKKSLAAPSNGSLPGQVSIPPGQFAFLLTEESLIMPDKVMGFISMRAGFKMNGLINVSGFHVDPGFRGQLVFAVYNAGPAPVNLARGEPIFLLWFADLDDSASERFSRKNKDPQTEIPNDLISRINHPILSLQELSDRQKAIEATLKNFKWIAGILAAIASLIFGGLKLWDSYVPAPASKPALEQPKPTPLDRPKSGVDPAPKGASAPQQ
jgi:dCTP deaminase